MSLTLHIRSSATMYSRTSTDDGHLSTTATFLSRWTIHAFTLISINLYNSRLSITATATKARPNCQTNLSTTASKSANDERCIQNSIFHSKRSRNLTGTARRWSLFLFHWYILIASLISVLQKTYFKNKNIAPRN